MMQGKTFDISITQYYGNNHDRSSNNNNNNNNNDNNNSNNNNTVYEVLELTRPRDVREAIALREEKYMLTTTNNSCDCTSLLQPGSVVIQGRVHNHLLTDVLIWNTATGKEGFNMPAVVTCIVGVVVVIVLVAVFVFVRRRAMGEMNEDKELDDIAYIHH